MIARIAWLHALIVTAVVGVFGVPSVRAADEPTAQTKTTALPGRIYIVAPFPRDVMRGLLAVDPNERTFATIDQNVSPTSRVAPGGRGVSYLRIDREAGKVLPVVLDLEADRGPVQVDDRAALLSWAGDGKRLILSRVVRDADPSAPRSWRIKPDGSEREKLDVPATELIVDWSSDGQWLLAHSGRRGEADPAAPGHMVLPLFVMRIDGAEAMELVSAGAIAKPEIAGSLTISTSYARFSPDGRTVCYIRATREGELLRPLRQDMKLWVVGRNGENRHVVFEGTDDEGHPDSAAWSSDGKTIAVGLEKPRAGRRRGLGAEHRLLIIDADGTNRREIPLPHTTQMSVVEWR